MSNTGEPMNVVYTTQQLSYEQICQENAMLKQQLNDAIARILALEQANAQNANPAISNVSQPARKDVFTDQQTSLHSVNTASSSSNNVNNTPNNRDSTKEKANVKVVDPLKIKPPPIYVSGIKKISEFDEFLKPSELDKCERRTLPNEQVIVKAKTIDEFRKLTSILDNEIKARDHLATMGEVLYHTYQLKCDRPFILFVRRLHPTTDIEDVANEFRTWGHKPRKISNVQIKKKVGNRRIQVPLPLFRVELEPQDNNKEALDIVSMLNVKVQMEPPRKIYDIPQCKRCQEIGHSQNYCRKTPRCVKCGDNHHTNDCKKPKSTKSKCANCKGEHTSNYKGCPVYKERIQAMQRKKTTATERLRQKDAPITRPAYTQAGTSFAAAAAKNAQTNASKQAEKKRRY